MNKIYTHMPEEKEMREVFAETMEELSADKKVVYLDADIINSIKMTEFARKHPDQSVNCGIQEANMISVAAGLSAEGFIPYAHSFAPFVTRRAMDQVFMSIAYAKLNVRVIGSDPGITAGSNGGTHMPFEDLSIMRSIQKSIVVEPSDSMMLKSILKQSKDIYGLTYIRLSRKKAIALYDENDEFVIGRAKKLREGDKASLLACGLCVDDCLQAAERLSAEGIETAVYDMFTIKPIDKEAIRNAAKCGLIVTAENHNTIGGLGSAVCEVVCEQDPCRVIRLGCQDEFGEVGTMDYLKKKLGFTVDDIYNAVKRGLEK